MHITLTGKTALVTGASRGIGEGIARRLAETGAHVLLAARSVDRVQEIAAEITASGGKATGVELDITAADVRDRAGPAGHRHSRAARARKPAHAAPAHPAPAHAAPRHR